MWTMFCPSVNNLVIEFSTPTEETNRPQFLQTGILVALLAFKGVTHLELNNYKQDWLTEVLLKESYAPFLAFFKESQFTNLMNKSIV